MKKLIGLLYHKNKKCKQKFCIFSFFLFFRLFPKITSQKRPKNSICTEMRLERSETRSFFKDVIFINFAEKIKTCTITQGKKQVF